MTRTTGIAAALTFSTLLACHDDLASTSPPCDDLQGCPAGQVCSGGRCRVVDAAAADLRPDMPVPDRTPDEGRDSPGDSPVKDLPAKDVGDLSPPDAPTPDKAVPDMQVPDLPVPDLPAPDKALPDKALPDKGAPDTGKDAFQCTSAKDCDDGLVCTTDTCGDAGCSHSLQSGFCLIVGVCYPKDYFDPVSKCQKCDPVSSKTYWTKTITDACVTSLAGGFYRPFGVAVDGAGKVYVADQLYHRIGVVYGGKVSTLAGNGKSGFLNGTVATARFHNPTGVALDGAGKVYVADSTNNRIRLVHTGQVTTLAGTGTAGFADAPAAWAMFKDPSGVAMDSTGKLYVADVKNHMIRVVHKGQVSTLAGSGMDGFANGSAASAMFDTPWGVAVDSAGQVFVADKLNHRIRVVYKGQVSTLAGSGKQGLKDGVAGSAMFKHPIGVAVDSAGKVYVGDQFNNVIRAINP